MFFLLSKILGFFALPSNLLVTLGLLGVALYPTRYARTGRKLAIVSIVLIAIVGWSPLGNALILPLEDRFPQWDASHGAPDGIVVLGGAVDELVSNVRGEFALNEAAERMTATIDLALRYPRARVLFSGGSGYLIAHAPTEAEVAVKMLESFGITRNRIIAEDRGRTTAENAMLSKALAAPKPGERWLLVTSAHHMPRAVGAFRRAAFAVEPYPVDWRTRGQGDLLRPFGSLFDGLKRTDTAAREWAGLVIYWLTGRSSELFPGP
jgi:uncharacterized SAM-binding protein YcdF (DUF218 family)